MKLRGWRLSFNSLRIKLIASVLIMTVPLIVMLIYNNFYAITVVREQVANSYNDSTTLYMKQIDADLNDVDKYMNTTAAGYDLIAVGQALSDDDYYMDKVSLARKLNDDLALYPTISAFFVYEQKRQDFMEVLGGNFLSYGELEQVKSGIVDLIQQNVFQKVSSSKRWQYHKIGQGHYLIDVVHTGDAYLGAWISLDQLITPLQTLKIGTDGEVIFVNDEGRLITDTTIVDENGIELRKPTTDYYLSGSEKKFLVVAAPSQYGELSLATLIPDTMILANLPYLQRIIWLITIGSMLFIPIGLGVIRMSFLKPLQRLLLAMRQVRGGDWSTRVDTRKTPEEFMLIGDSFNSMMTEIQTLRVNVFEEQLNKQREELNRLQLQVNPHFFLNALNIVYNLAKVKNYELIMEMTMALIKYFRFLFRTNTSFVKLGDELEHTRNYLNIQILRFPDQLTWSVDAPVYLSGISIPPLAVQSFVENAIKHAVTMDKPIDISVTADFYDEEGSNLRIVIKDTGRGFQERVLEELRAGGSIQNDQGEHTGIWNVQRRLKLLYGEAASVSVYNDAETGGAVVQLLLPTRPIKEE